MSRLRGLLFSLFFFFLGTFFGKTILLEGGAFFLKYYLLFDQKIAFTYQKIDWRDGKVWIEGAHLQTAAFDAEIQQIRVALFAKKIEMDSPYLFLWGIPELPQGEGNWKFAVNDGVIFRQGMGEIHFSCERNWPYQLGRFFFQKDKSKWSVEALSEGKGKSFYINCEQFDLSLLQEWCDVKGEVDGWLHLFLEKNRWKNGMAHLQVVGGGYEEKVRSLVGELDWEGGVDFPFSKGSHFRMTLQEGEIVGTRGSVQNIAGMASFAADLGAKWEFFGQGIVENEAFPLSLDGKAFLQGKGAEWVHLSAAFDQCTFLFQSEEKRWSAELEGMSAKEAKLVQSFLSWIEPKANYLEFEKLQLDGQAEGIGLDFSIKLAAEDFVSSQLDCEQLDAFFSSEKETSFVFSGASFSFNNKKGRKWQGSATISDGGKIVSDLEGMVEEWELYLSLVGQWKEEGLILEEAKGKVEDLHFQLAGWVGGEEDWFLQGKGDLANGMHFTFPLIEKREEGVFFDLRLDHTLFDAARLCGLWTGQALQLDEKLSQFAGFPLEFDGVLRTSFPAQEVPRRASLFSKQFGKFRNLPSLEGDVALMFSLEKGERPIYFVAEQIRWEEAGRSFFQGNMKGALDTSFQLDLQLENFTVDLAAFKRPSLEGQIEGSGCFAWNGEWEADFDLVPSRCKWQGLSLENQGAIHLSLDSKGKALCTGVDLQAEETGAHLQTDLVEVDLIHLASKLHECRIYLPAQQLVWESGRDLDILADFEWSLEKRFSCFVKEGQIPWGQELYAVKDLSLFYDKERISLFFHHIHPTLPAKVELVASLQDYGKWSGKFCLQEEDSEEKLSISLDYQKHFGLSIEAVDGAFGGVEASFRKMGKEEPLIGWAKVHCGRVVPFLPPKLVELVEKLHMGKGYEFRGKLALFKEHFAFEGIISGKQVELFGFQFRSLLGQIAFSEREAVLSDLKISDEAGILKIDTIQAQGGAQPWTISIPHLMVSELRPSLLRKPGEEEKELQSAGPLVVRELAMRGFSGLLDEPKSYRARGTLTFINSYRREHTVFDIPADLLSRIVGLDLELLIPVRGCLDFTLQEGLFHLKELQNAYSEADRSQFALVMDPEPIMDLDGNLRLFVQMKQFVLFKLTESLWISIDGKLNDPKFHLRKKKVRSSDL